MENWHLWTIAGILLIIVEMLTYTFFAAAFGVAAFVAAYASTRDVGTTWEIGIFTIASALGVLGIRPLFSKVIYKRSEYKPVLVAALIGQNGTVVDSIESEGGHGRVKTGGEEWRAIASDPRSIPAGTRVRIVAVDGATLTVIPV